MGTASTTPQRTLFEATEAFFKERNFADAQNIFFKLFQCWSVQECYKRIDLTDAEVTLFCDGLLNVVSGAYLVYQATRGLNIQEIRHE